MKDNLFYRIIGMVAFTIFEILIIIPLQMCKNKLNLVFKPIDSILCKEQCNISYEKANTIIQTLTIALIVLYISLIASLLILFFMIKNYNDFDYYLITVTKENGETSKIKIEKDTQYPLINKIIKDLTLNGKYEYKETKHKIETISPTIAPPIQNPRTPISRPTERQIKRQTTNVSTPLAKTQRTSGSVSISSPTERPSERPTREPTVSNIPGPSESIIKSEVKTLPLQTPPLPITQLSLSTRQKNEFADMIQNKIKELNKLRISQPDNNEIKKVLDDYNGMLFATLKGKNVINKLLQIDKQHQQLFNRVKPDYELNRILQQKRLEEITNMQNISKLLTKLDDKNKDKIIYDIKSLRDDLESSTLINQKNLIKKNIDIRKISDSYSKLLQNNKKLLEKTKKVKQPLSILQRQNAPISYTKSQLSQNQPTSDIQTQRQSVSDTQRQLSQSQPISDSQTQRQLSQSQLSQSQPVSDSQTQRQSVSDSQTQRQSVSDTQRQLSQSQPVSDSQTQRQLSQQQNKQLAQLEAQLEAQQQQNKRLAQQQNKRLAQQKQKKRLEQEQQLSKLAAQLEPQISQQLSKLREQLELT